MNPFNITRLNLHTFHFHSVEILSSFLFWDTLRTDIIFPSYKRAHIIGDHQWGIRSQGLATDLTLCIHYVLKKIGIQCSNIYAIYIFREGL